MTSFYTFDRFPWKKTPKIGVYSFDFNDKRIKEIVIKETDFMMNEFNGSFEIFNINEIKIDSKLIEDIINSSLLDNKINAFKILDDVGSIRKENKLNYSIIIIIDENKYELYEEGGCELERAEYGLGYEYGLVFLRHITKDAIRHELGHMMGLDHHDPPYSLCINNWECTFPDFCEDCIKSLNEFFR